MLNHFVKIQRQHQDYRRKAYKEALCSNEGEELTDLIKNLPTLSRAQGTPAPQKTYEAKKKPIPAVPATLTQLFQRGRNDWSLLSEVNFWERNEKMELLCVESHEEKESDEEKDSQVGCFLGRVSSDFLFS